MSARAERARETLAHAGVEPGTADEALHAALAGADAPAVAEALGELGDARVAALLAAAEPQAGTRALRKALRRALHRLQERGVSVPERAAEAPVLARPLAQPPEGLMSAVDGTGSRIVWLTRDQPSGAVVLVAAEVNVPAGLRDLAVSETSRRQIREARRRLRREARLQVVPTPFEVLDALLVEGQDRLAEVERRLDYRRVRSRLTTQPVAAPREPVSSRVAPPAEAEMARLLAESASLLDEPELATWWPTPERAAGLLEQIDAMDDSPLVLNEAQQQQRLAGLLSGAREALYPADPTARWLDANAYVLAETDRIEAARRALAVAHLLRAAPQRADAVPLFATLLNQGVGRLLALRRERLGQERRDALVMTPAEAVRARSSSHPGRTRG